MPIFSFFKRSGGAQPVKRCYLDKVLPVAVILNKIPVNKNARVKKNRLSWLKVDSGKIDARVKVLSPI